MDEVNIVYEYLKHENIKDPVMFDVGAHAGGSLYQFARDKWKIYAFEPNPSMIEKLNQNMTMWNIHSQVKLFPVALGEEKKHVDFYVSNESTGISSVIPFRDSHQKALQVEVTTVKDICKENNIGKIHFLKIDVEGNDMNVLKGVNWEKNAPDVVIAEFEDYKTKSLNIIMPDIFNYLKERGYYVVVSEWQPIKQYGIEHSWNKFLMPENATNYNPAGWGNLIAFKNFDYGVFASAVQTASNKQLQKVKQHYVNSMAPRNLLSRVKNKLKTVKASLC